MLNPPPLLAVIGGSGLYEMSGLSDTQTIEPETPFGRASAPVVVGTLEGKRVAFLARHGIGHTLSPSEVNYRANIWALKSLGCQQVVSISACGSLREDYAPGHIIIPQQLFDFTRGTRQRTFFEQGIVAHIGSAEPFCSRLSDILHSAVVDSGATVHRGGTLITIEGPRFSTRGESNLFRAWGISIIGMTASPEAFLAREAEMCYSVMAHVTDYDVWHVSEEAVTVEMVVRTLMRNTQFAQQALREMLLVMDEERGCDCGDALASALITHPDAVSPEARERLSLLTDRYLKR